SLHVGAVPRIERRVVHRQERYVPSHLFVNLQELESHHRTGVRVGSRGDRIQREHAERTLEVRLQQRLLAVLPPILQLAAPSFSELRGIYCLVGFDTSPFVLSVSLSLIVDDSCKRLIPYLVTGFADTKRGSDILVMCWGIVRFEAAQLFEEIAPDGYCGAGAVVGLPGEAILRCIGIVPTPVIPGASVLPYCGAGLLQGAVFIE